MLGRPFNSPKLASVVLAGLIVLLAVVPVSLTGVASGAFAADGKARSVSKVKRKVLQKRHIHRYQLEQVRKNKKKKVKRAKNKKKGLSSARKHNSKTKRSYKNRLKDKIRKKGYGKYIP